MESSVFFACSTWLDQPASSSPDFAAGPCLRQIRAVPPFLRRVRELREIKQHRRKPVPAIIGAGGRLLSDLQLFEQRFYAGGELRAHLRRGQTGASRQLSRVAVAGKCETGINEQKQGQACKAVV